MATTRRSQADYNPRKTGRINNGTINNNIFTMTELCHHTGVSKEELQEIVELGVIEPVEITTQEWFFNDDAVVVVHRALKTSSRVSIGLAWYCNRLDIVG